MMATCTPSTCRVIEAELRATYGMPRASQDRIWREGCGARLTQASKFRYRHKKGRNDIALCNDLSAQGLRSLGAEGRTDFTGLEVMV
jgi:hypothetical protein